MTHPDQLTMKIAAALLQACDLSLAAMREAALPTYLIAEARERMAVDVQHVMEHADPNGPTPRLAYGWKWDDAARPREQAHSLGVAVDVLSPDGTDRFPLGAWRCRDLRDAHGRRIDTAETLRWLQQSCGLGAIPDDPATLADAGPAIAEPPADPWLVSELAHQRWFAELTDPSRIRLVIAALHNRACCVGADERVAEPTDEHRAAHVAAARLEQHGRVPQVRAALLARLQAARGQDGTTP